MKLDELHVCDLGARSPRHGHPISGRDIRIGRVEINFAATAGREHNPIGTNRFYLSRSFIQNVDAKTSIFRRESDFGRGDQIHGHVILQ